MVKMRRHLLVWVGLLYALVASGCGQVLTASGKDWQIPPELSARMTGTQAAIDLAVGVITPTPLPVTLVPTKTPIYTRTPIPSKTSIPQPTDPPTPGSPDESENTPTISPQPTATLTLTENPTDSPTATSNPVLQPENWRSWTVIPSVSDKAKEIYQLGLELGNNPNAFSVVGDCQAISKYFMSPFDDSQLYRLGPYTELQAAIDHFKGSFSHESVAVQSGFNVASVLNPLKSDEAQCHRSETPLECEYRLYKPSFMIISMETWWSKRPADQYEKYLRQIVTFAMDHGVVPILATKADNQEGDNSINYAIARVASAYQMPLWNFWAKTQTLPGGGIIEDGFHLTGLGFYNYFDDPGVMSSAWPNRNLTALQALDAVWRAVSQP